MNLKIFKCLVYITMLNYRYLCFKSSIQPGVISKLRSHQSFGLRMSTTPDGPPPIPKSFGKYFKLPKNRPPLNLENINRHPIDRFLTFDEDSHRYYFKNQPIPNSVTKVVESYFEEFDADAVAQKMVSGSQWPREGYMNSNGEPLTIEEIKMKWENQGEYARNYGTWIHYNIELYLNDQMCNEVPEVKMYQQFEAEYIVPKDITAFRTEWRIVAPDKSIAGSVDFVGEMPDGTYCIMDWKTSKNLPNRLEGSYGKKARPPLEYLDDCEGIKYFLQLNLYKYILENYYNMRISLMVLASFNKSFPKYFMVEVPDMQGDVEILLADYTSRFQNQEPPPQAAAAPKEDRNAAWPPKKPNVNIPF